MSHNASGTVNYSTSSDERLKQDIELSTDTDVIDNLKVHKFTWKSDNLEDIGLFAQEAYLIKPTAVGVGTDELTEDGSLKTPWSVDYSKFVPDLIVYSQQLKKQLEELKAIVDAQAVEIEALKSK